MTESPNSQATSVAQSVPSLSAPAFRFWRHLGALLLVLAIILGAALAAESLGRMQRLGYLGAFLANLIGSATVILPVPGVAVTFALGGTLAYPLFVGILAGLGAALGETTGYLAGYSGRIMVEEGDRYQWLVTQTRRYGGYFFFAMAAVPNPFFDLAGIAAGALRYPLSRFLLAILPGQILKMTLIAYAGAGLLPTITHWLRP